MQDGVEPRPEDFGISPEIVERTPPALVASHPGALVVAAVATVAVAAFVIGWMRSGSAAGAAFFTIVLVAASLILLVPAAWLVVCAACKAEDHLRARRDPLWRACQAYRSAVEASRARRERGASPAAGALQRRWRRLDRRALCHAVADRLVGEGWRVETIARPDLAGVDLVAEKSGRRLAVRCEPGEAPIGLAEARQLAAARLELAADEALLVCPGGVLPAVRELTTLHPLRLADASALGSTAVLLT